MLMFCNQVANCRRKVTGKSRFVFAIYKDIYTSIVQQEASGRSVTEYMMDGVSAKSELQADEFMSLFCRIIDWETFPDFIHL